jgi:hypothetical protein
MATTYTPTGGAALDFHLLVEPPTRDTRQTASERPIPGSNDVVVDVIGKATTKIRGRAYFDSYAALKTFEGAVGTDGVLVYSEEPLGIDVLFIALERDRVTPQDLHFASVEFWITA